MKILVIQLLVLFCCLSSTYASTKLKHRAAASPVSFIDPNKFYYLRDVRSTKYLNRDMWNNKVQIWEYNGFNNQQWKFDFSSGSYYTIRNANNTNNILTCTGNQVDCSVTTAASNAYKQKWAIAQYTGSVGNTFGGVSNPLRIQLVNLDFGSVLDADNTGNGAGVGCWNSYQGANQIWVLHAVDNDVPSIPQAAFYVDYVGAGSKLFHIRNLLSGKYLDWDVGSKKLQQWGGSNGNNQRWLFRAGNYADGYRIVSWYDTSRSVQCPNTGSCQVPSATSSYTIWQLIDYTGPEKNTGAAGRMVVLRTLDYGHYLSVVSQSDGAVVSAELAWDGINGSKFMRQQVWVLE